VNVVCMCGDTATQHRECMLRSGLGGIGHLLDHDEWCIRRGDTDAGMSFRDSALAVAELVARFGPDEVLSGTFTRPTLDEVRSWVETVQMGPVTSACPNCGAVEARRPYDIGSGPELSCAHCEWCWGAKGQPLKPYVPPPISPT
jgi:hypothetical protein